MIYLYIVIRLLLIDIAMKMNREVSPIQEVQLRGIARPTKLQLEHPETFGVAAIRMMYRLALRDALGADGKYKQTPYIQVVPAYPVDFPRLMAEHFSFEKPSLGVKKTQEIPEVQLTVTEVFSELA